jgi:hypothetical protein
MRILKTTRQTMERTTFVLALTLAASGILTGCGTGAGMSSGLGTVQGAAVHGNVHGGQQPIVGAILQLYAAGSSGYGSAATPLISSVVKTDSSGNFSIGGDFTCTSGSQLIYLTATQGDAGAGNNPNLALMVALGPCSDLGSIPFVWLNEVTTVASVWALSPFMTGFANVGAPMSNVTGLTNAFADTNTLVDITKGSSPGAALPAGTFVPSSEIYTLSNILASCVNSAGGAAGTPTTNCGKLFSSVNPGTGAAPSDTIAAAMDIAQHPGFNVGALYTLPGPDGAAFPSGLTLQPNDFTIAVNFTSGGISAPAALAADASGNVWVANGTGAAVTELSHSGTPVPGSPFAASLSGASAIAIDASGGPWITNKTGNSVSRLTSSGSVVAGSPYNTAGFFVAPTGIAFDLMGNAWISNSGDNSLSILNSAGAVQRHSPTGLSTPVSIGVNPR